VTGILQALLAIALTAGFPPASRNSVDVQIGGVMSGPSRRYVDLDRNRLFVSHPPSRRGDSAGVSTRNLEVASSRALTAREVQTIRGLAQTVLRDGPESRQRCQPNADRILQVNLALGGRTSSGTVYCPSAAVQSLVGAIFGLPT
jgi:hypothetical protein